MIIQSTIRPQIPLTAQDLPRNPAVLSVAGTLTSPLSRHQPLSNPDKLGKDIFSLAKKSVELMGEIGLIEYNKTKKDEITGAFLFLNGQHSLQNAQYENGSGKQTLQALSGTLKIVASTQAPKTPGANFFEFGIGLTDSYGKWAALTEKENYGLVDLISPVKTTLSTIQNLAKSREQVPSFVSDGIGLFNAGLSGAQAFQSFHDPNAKVTQKALKMLGAVGEMSKAVLKFFPAAQMGAWTKGIECFCLMVQVADTTVTVYNEIEGAHLLSTPSTPQK